MMMNTLRPSRGGWTTAVIGLASALTLAVACPAWAQHQTTDPYNPYGAAYSPYAFPTYRPSVDMYGKQGAPGGSGMNQLDRYFEANGFGTGPALRPSGSADGDLFATPGRGSRPYYEAYRRYDQAYGRTSGLSDADQEFYRNRQKREQAYREALNESDPKVRAKKMQAVERMRLEAARDVPAASRRSTTQKKSRSAAPAPRSARPTSSRAVGTTPAAPAVTPPRAATGPRSDTSRRPTSPAPGNSLRLRSGQNLSRPHEPMSVPNRTPSTLQPQPLAPASTAPPSP
ncbi:MAG: hypothetical protein ABI353_00415 [Isosphaeraceae bacterium]